MSDPTGGGDRPDDPRPGAPGVATTGDRAAPPDDATSTATAPAGRRRTCRDGARAAAPLAVAVGLFGASFGVLARAAGLGAVTPLVFSATTFAGSAQFAALSVLASGGGAATAVAAAVLLNARYGPIGLSVAPVLRGGPLRRFAEAQLVVDESWALSQRHGGFDRHVLLGAGALLYAAWVTGTAAGAGFGSLVGDPDRLGLDAAFPALFLALLVPQLRSRRTLLAACAGAAIAVALVPATPAGVPIIASCVACLVGARRR